MQNSTMPLDGPADNRIRIRINAEIRIWTRITFGWDVGFSWRQLAEVYSVVQICGRH